MLGHRKKLLARQKKAAYRQFLKEQVFHLNRLHKENRIQIIKQALSDYENCIFRYYYRLDGLQETYNHVTHLVFVDSDNDLISPQIQEWIHMCHDLGTYIDKYDRRFYFVETVDGSEICSAEPKDFW